MTKDDKKRLRTAIDYLTPGGEGDYINALRILYDLAGLGQIPHDRIEGEEIGLEDVEENDHVTLPE